MTHSRTSSSATSPSGVSTSAGDDHVDAAFNFTKLPTAPAAPTTATTDELFFNTVEVEQLEPEFWMMASQTHSGTALTERMNSVFKQIVSAQVEFSDKMALISHTELARLRASNDDSPVYRAYWANACTALRLCRQWAIASKEMTMAMKKLIVPMDRLVSVGRQRLKETATWNVDLNKALSVFHTNIAKRQAKCYKALGSVMTPEYFEKGPSKKARAVRRAAPTVQKYVEQIDEANVWLSRYMERRPTLMGRLRALEQKRLQVSRDVLQTYAENMKTIGDTIIAGASDVAGSVAAIDDVASMNEFVRDCRKKPTPHLEDPPLFTYSLPVPIEELGLRAPKDVVAARTSHSTRLRKTTLKSVEQHNRDLERSATTTDVVDEDDAGSIVSDGDGSQAPNRNTGNKLGSFAAALFHTVTGAKVASPRRGVEHHQQQQQQQQQHANVPRRTEFVDENATETLKTLQNIGGDVTSMKPKTLSVDVVDNDGAIEVAPSA